jgi:hypothetical protein
LVQRVAEIARQRDEAQRLSQHYCDAHRDALLAQKALAQKAQEAERERCARLAYEQLMAQGVEPRVRAIVAAALRALPSAPPATPETPMEFPTATQPCSYCGRPYGSSYGGSQDITGTREYWTHVRCYVPKPAPATAEPAREKCNGFHAADCGHTVACDLYAVPDTPRDEKEKI